MFSRDSSTAVSDGDLSGKVVSGRYVLGCLLGAGGMAEVYRAHDTRLDRSVAVKLFQGTATTEDQIRLDREAQMLATLGCPGLVTVFDTGSYQGHPFYVMQVIDGGTLRQRMRQALPPALVARVGAQVAETLAVVHAGGVVHRDIKPSNILLDDEEKQAYLADFGLALQAHVTRLTRSGMLVGTAGYLAPEQLRGADVAPPTDIYALGLVLLECLTGHPEYPGGDTEAALARLSREARIPIGLPAPWPELLASMTNSDPKCRPTADQCANRLRVAEANSAGVPALVDARTEVRAKSDDEPKATRPVVRESQTRRLALVLGGTAVASVVAVTIIVANLSDGTGRTAPVDIQLVPTTVVEEIDGPAASTSTPLTSTLVVQAPGAGTATIGSASEPTTTTTEAETTAGTTTGTGTVMGTGTMAETTSATTSTERTKKPKDPKDP